MLIDTNTNVTHKLDELKARGVTVIGRYYAPSAWKRITKPEAIAISQAGFGLIAVFEHTGSPALTRESGAHDAKIALDQALGIGQAAGAIYFALENLPHGYTRAHVPGIEQYFLGVRDVIGTRYKVGCYSSGAVLEAMLQLGLIDFAWLSASSSFEGSRAFDAAHRWHLAQRKIDLDWSGVSVDINDVGAPDCGAFVVAEAAPSSSLPALLPPEPLPDHIADAQERLNDLKYFVGAVDGILGRRTRAGLRTFQEQHGLAVTGELDRATYDALFTDDAKAMPVSEARASTSTLGLMADGSRTVASTQTVKRSSEVVAAMLLGDQAFDAISAAQQSIARAEQAIETVEKGKGVLEHAFAVLPFLATPKGIFLVIVLGLLALQWWKAHSAEAARVDDARTGANAGR